MQPRRISIPRIYNVLLCCSRAEVLAAILFFCSIVYLYLYTARAKRSNAPMGPMASWIWLGRSHLRCTVTRSALHYVALRCSTLQYHTFVLDGFPVTSAFVFTSKWVTVKRITDFVNEHLWQLMIIGGVIEVCLHLFGFWGRLSVISVDLLPRPLANFCCL